MEIFTNPIRVIPGNRLIISNFKDFLTNGTSLADGVKISGTTPDTRRIENMTPPWLLWKTEDEQLTLDGRWKLTPNHDLELHVKSSNYPELDGEKIIFRGRIENVEGNSFSFRVQQTDNILGIRSGVITLTGKWQADKNNRLSFLVSKSRNVYDSLTFEGAWEVNNNNEIVYKYTRGEGRSRDKETHLVIFRGYWDLPKGKLNYRFDHSSDSMFSFKAEFMTDTFSSKDRKLQFIVGVSYKQYDVYKTQKRIITIYGSWKLNRDLKLTFSVSYSNRRSRELEFGIEKLFGKHDSLEISLLSKDGDPLGVSVEFKKAFRDNGEFFLALSRSAKESKILGGIRLKF